MEEKTSQEVRDLQQSLNEVILKVELSKKDIREIEKFHSRAEVFISEVRESLVRIDRIIQAQELITANLETELSSKLSEQRERIEQVRRELSEGLSILRERLEKTDERTRDIKQTIPEKIKSDMNTMDIDGRIRILENFKWKWVGIIIGASMVFSILASAWSSKISAILGG